MSIIYRKFGTKRKFGVEIELGNEVPKRKIKRYITKVAYNPVKCSGWTTSNNNQYWHLKDDATCGKDGWDGSRGFELASFVASGWIDLLEVERVVDAVQHSGAKVNKNCGVHVHVDVADFSKQDIAVLLANWLKIELRMLHAVPRRRAASEGFSKPLMHSTSFYLERDHRYSPDDLWALFMPSDGNPYALDRAVTLNFTNYLKSLAWGRHWDRKTVEFRWPEGTTSGVDVKNWVRLFVNFVEYSKGHSMPADICHSDLDETLDILGLGHTDGDFTILSSGLHDTKTWFLERIIKHYDEYPYLERKRQTERAKEILNEMWMPVRKY